MPRSMTGFGRGEVRDAVDEFTVELKTVNHRYLDWNVRLPMILSPLENRIREYISKRIKRGRISVNVWHSRGEESLPVIHVNKPLIKSFCGMAKDLSVELGYEVPVTLRDLLQVPDAIKIEDEERDLEATFAKLKPALDGAIGALLVEREREGVNLTADLLARVEHLQMMMAEIQERAPQIVIEYRERLKKRLDEMLGDVPVATDRLEAEVAFMADRGDITEELVRLKSHLNQAKGLLSKEECGGPLGFLAQEILREINTIGSKAGDLSVSQSVLAMKAEVEKIKEQVANLE